ncbi:MAG: DUF333 domain-containing protein [Candidatus Moranbacteria bacterium]|nr:DUF333 domain-containing protein [Candidatus Moranbacteria bacterium]
MNKKIAIEIAVAIVIIIAGIFGLTFWYGNNKAIAPTTIVPAKNAQQAENKNIGIANPASVYCEQNGGKLEIQTASDGGQNGICKFPDGSQCDEWAYYRGECKPVGSLKNNSLEKGWKVYKNSQYNFELAVPDYVNTGQISENSVVGTYNDPIKGIYIGNLILIVADNKDLKEKAKEYFEGYYVKGIKTEGDPKKGPSITCEGEEILNNYATMRIVSCNGEGGPATYGLIEAEKYMIFVDGYSVGFSQNQELSNEIVSFKNQAQEIKKMMASFKIANN